MVNQKREQIYKILHQLNRQQKEITSKKQQPSRDDKDVTTKKTAIIETKIETKTETKIEQKLLIQEDTSTDMETEPSQLTSLDASSDFKISESMDFESVPEVESMDSETSRPVRRTRRKVLLDDMDTLVQ